jgi:aminoglycoside phosphotransferase (APT) family kinase protein
MHDDELTVALDVATGLIADQFPQFRALPVERVSSTGTVNAIFRIGSDLAARFPIRPAPVEDVLAGLKEGAAAASALAAHSPVPTPVPVAIGMPGRGYPLPWSIQTWIEGTPASERDESLSIALAKDLATFVSSLRSIDTHGARFVGGGRGGDLRSHDDWMATCFARSEQLLDVGRLRAMWRELRELPVVGPDVMSHRDLIPGNVLVRAGRLVGVLDTEGFGPADRALDLVAGWSLLEEAPRDVVRGELACGDVEWARGRAWALVQAMGATWYYVSSNPSMSAMGRRMIDRLLADQQRGAS